MNLPYCFSFVEFWCVIFECWMMQLHKFHCIFLIWPERVNLFLFHSSYLPSQLAAVSLYVAGRIMFPDHQPSVSGPYGEPMCRQMEDELLRVISIQKDKALGKKYAKDRYKNVMQYIKRYE